MEELTETCVLCGKSDLTCNLGGLWFVNDARGVVHLDCWLLAYESERDRTQSFRRSA